MGYRPPSFALIITDILTPNQIEAELPGVCACQVLEAGAFFIQQPLFSVPPPQPPAALGGFAVPEGSMGHRRKTTDFQILMEKYRRFLSKRVI